MIALIDRLAAYAAREAENESPEERQRQEEEAAKRLVGEVKKQRERAKAGDTGAPGVKEEEMEGWGVTVLPPPVEGAQDDGLIDGIVPRRVQQVTAAVGKFRGIPDDVKLFEVFWHQIVELIKARSSVRSARGIADPTSAHRLAPTCQYKTSPHSSSPSSTCPSAATPISSNTST